MKKFLPSLSFLCALGAMGGLHVLLPGGRLVSGAWRFVAIVPLILGVGVAMAAGRKFRRHRTTIVPFETPSALVTHGVYAFTRNPMYLSLALVLCSAALHFGTASPWLGVAGFMLAVDRLAIVPEEKILDEKFGVDYKNYRKRVRRWM